MHTYDNDLVVNNLDNLHMTLTIRFAFKIVVFTVAMSFVEIIPWNFSITYSRHMSFISVNEAAVS